MKIPSLGKVPYFRIPPRVTLSELEDKLEETDLPSNDLVRICGLKPSHDSGVDVCPPCAQSASNKIA